MYFRRTWSSCFICFYFTLCSNVGVTTTLKNGTSTEETHSFSAVTTVAVVVGTSMLLSAFVVIVAFLFCCKSKMNSEDADPPEDSTSMVSLADHVEPNNAQVIGNPSIVMQDMFAKGRNKITKMTSSRRHNDTQTLNTCDTENDSRQDIQF